MPCTWGGLPALTLCQTPSRGGHQPPAPCPHHATCACFGLSTQRAYVHTCGRCTRTPASLYYSCFFSLSFRSTSLFFTHPQASLARWRLGPGHMGPTRHGEKGSLDELEWTGRAGVRTFWTPFFVNGVERAIWPEIKPMRPTKRC
jgi:hypothetical protein